MSEILDHVEPPMVPERRHAGDIEIGIEQVLPVWCGLHQCFEDFFRARVISDVFSGLIDPQARIPQPRHQGRLAVKLMRELLPLNHQSSVRTCRIGQTFVRVQRRHASCSATLIGKGKQCALGGTVFGGGGHGRREQFGGGLGGSLCRARTVSLGGRGSLRSRIPRHCQQNNQDPKHFAPPVLSCRKALKFCFPSPTLASRIHPSYLRWRHYF
jgi:hypothetical protein